MKQDDTATSTDENKEPVPGYGGLLDQSAREVAKDHPEMADASTYRYEEKNEEAQVMESAESIAYREQNFRHEAVAHATRLLEGAEPQHRTLASLIETAVGIENYLRDGTAP